MPRNPAASQIGTPRCISPVAAVWRKGVWGDVVRQTGEPHSRFGPHLHRCDRFAVELNKAGDDQLALPRATQVSKQPRRYGRRCLALLGDLLADWLAIEDAALRIDVI